MNIIHNTTRISRRHFLKGAGVAMALPLLDGMVPVRAADEKALRPRRSIFISLPDGVHVRAWQIAEAGPSLPSFAVTGSAGKTPLANHPHQRSAS